MFHAMVHWTDQKSRVPAAAYLVLPLVWAARLHREPAQRGSRGAGGVRGDLANRTRMGTASRRAAVSGPSLRVTKRPPALVRLVRHFGLAMYYAAVTR